MTPDIYVAIGMIVVLVFIATVGVLEFYKLPAPEPRRTTAAHFPAGTVITCPGCNRRIAKSKRDIYATESVTSSAWDGLDGHEIRPCSPVTCPDCKRSYLRSLGYRTQIHTSEGWR